MQMDLDHSAIEKGVLVEKTASVSLRSTVTSSITLVPSPDAHAVVHASRRVNAQEDVSEMPLITYPWNLGITLMKSQDVHTGIVHASKSAKVNSAGLSEVIASGRPRDAREVMCNSVADVTLRTAPVASLGDVMKKHCQSLNAEAPERATPKLNSPGEDH